MADTTPDNDIERSRIMLGLLDSVERDGWQSQRSLASELGIALGLVNAYLRRCIKKGLVKARQAPARRYVYYLTPQGFAEKSRLTVEFLSYSFQFFRQAKEDCASVFADARSRGFRRLALAGKSDLAEIAVISAIESRIEIVALVDRKANAGEFVGIPLIGSFAQLPEATDGVIITDLSFPRETYEHAVAQLGANRVLVPQLLRVRLDRPQGTPQ